jgi:hypothetical protein
MWARLRPNAAALLVFVALPVASLALWGAGSRDAGRWMQLLLTGWLLIGLVPAALLGRMERSVLARWKSLPVSAGEHWIGAFIALLPVTLVAGALLTLGAWLIGPASYQHPALLLVGALTVATMVSLGLAIATWSDSDWKLAGLLGLALLICVVPLFSGAPSILNELVPTGQARSALVALTSDAQGGLFAMLKLVMAAAVFVIVGILGERRA